MVASSCIISRDVPATRCASTRGVRTHSIAGGAIAGSSRILVWVRLLEAERTADSVRGCFAEFAESAKSFFLKPPAHPGETGGVYPVFAGPKFFHFGKGVRGCLEI